MVKYILIFFLVFALPAYGVEIDTDNNDAVDVTYGGTNSSTVAGARTNLDVYSKAESDELPGSTGGWGSSSEITLSGGVAALSGEGYYTIDTESDAASDDLTQITGLVAGDEVVICAEHTDRTVTVKTGTYFHIVEDFILNNTRDRLTLQCIGSDICVQKSRSNGGD